LREKHNYSEEDVLKWADDIATRWGDTENDLYPHFMQLLKEYQHLLRSFNRVTRLSDGYQKSLMNTNEYLSSVAKQDVLTGISNRRDMMDILDNEVKRANRYQHSFSIILIDIDHFKKVNDTYGHEVGDKVLVELARVLSDVLRDTDTESRWGGEEFLICLPHIEIDDAVNVAEKIRLAVADNGVVCRQQEIRITISAGVAQYQYGAPVDDLIRAADVALYTAKEQGRNLVCTPSPE